MPNNIISLGDYCFNGCTSLLDITLPNSITSLGVSCFNGCLNLIKVTCLWESLDNVSADATAFDNIFSEAKLHVPTGTTAIYKAKTPWSKFKSIIEDSTSGISPIKQCSILVQNADGFLTVSGLNDNEQVSLYNVLGMELGKMNAVQGTATFNVNPPDEIVILKVGNEAIKIQMK